MKINRIYLIRDSFIYNAFKGKSNSTKKTKVSVIIPIYNQEKYLPKALESLQAQSLEETEFICVNDGSDPQIDKSISILNEYANRDNRIKIINQENQGAGPARNNGLKQSNGEYIAFLDPDDWYEKNALQKLYETSKQKKCDMLVYNFNRINEATREILKAESVYNRISKNTPSFNVKENFTWKDFKPDVFRATYWMAWNKLYNSDFIKKNKLYFGKSSLAEDNIFIFNATLKAKSIGYLDDYLYNYLQHDNSATKKKTDKNFCFFKAIDGVKKSLIKQNLMHELQDEFDNYVAKLISIHSLQILSQDKLKEACYKKLSHKQLEILKKLIVI